MKHLALLPVFILSFLLSSSQNNVTFSVDMSEYSGSFTTISLNGSFNGWCGVCAEMTDDNSDLVYEIEIPLESATYEYKFTIDGLMASELYESFVPGGPCTITTGNFTNRVVEISGDTVLPTVCWESCGACGEVVSADVTFRVDMSQYTGPYNSVNLNGSFNGWCGGCAEMTDDNSDNIYELTTNIGLGTIEYKFTLNGFDLQENFNEGDPCTSTIDGFTNRTLEVTEDVVLDAVCYEECDECLPDGLPEFIEGHFKFFPNPSNGHLTMSNELPDSELLSIEVYNLEGRMVYYIQNPDPRTLDLTSLENGVYSLLVTTEKGASLEQVVLRR